LDPDFWQDQAAAKPLQQEKAAIEETLSVWKSLDQQYQELIGLSEIAQDEKDDIVLTELEVDLDKLESGLETLEHELRYDGPHDQAGAILTIQAGAGGTDAQDWAEMIERMYLRLAENMGWKTKTLNRSVGEEAGIKSSTIAISGRLVYGQLRGEQGVHRLVRLSPFNSDSLRQTSFARVEVVPQLPEQELPEIDMSDIEVDTFRASGAGGQHVNKTSSAVRVRHMPTGITVECQNERSQAQNKAQALSVVKAKLQQLLEEQRADEVSELRGKFKEAAWGNQIRSYVLHPYKMVKDHRTNVETSDVQAVLDGNLKAFLDPVFEAK
jgi:peptide chain release factor 2